MNTFTLAVKNIYAEKFFLPAELLAALASFLIAAIVQDTTSDGKENAVNHKVKVKAAKIITEGNRIMWWLSDRLNEETVAVPHKTMAPALFTVRHQTLRYVSILNKYSYHIIEKKSLPEMDVIRDQPNGLSNAIAGYNPFAMGNLFVSFPQQTLADFSEVKFPDDSFDMNKEVMSYTLSLR